MFNAPQIKGPFFSRQGAATYCGISPREFDRWRKEYNIPTHGPTKRNFAASILDDFMSAPNKYRLTHTQRTAKPISIDEITT